MDFFSLFHGLVELIIASSGEIVVDVNLFAENPWLKLMIELEFLYGSLPRPPDLRSVTAWTWFMNSLCKHIVSRYHCVDDIVVIWRFSKHMCAPIEMKIWLDIFQQILEYGIDNRWLVMMLEHLVVRVCIKENGFREQGRRMERSFPFLSVLDSFLICMVHLLPGVLNAVVPSVFQLGNVGHLVQTACQIGNIGHPPCVLNAAASSNSGFLHDIGLVTANGVPRQGEMWPDSISQPSVLCVDQSLVEPRVLPFDQNFVQPSVLPSDQSLVQPKLLHFNRSLAQPGVLGGYQILVQPTVLNAFQRSSRTLCLATLLHEDDVTFVGKGLCFKQGMFGWLKFSPFVMFGCRREKPHSNVVISLCVTPRMLLTQALLQRHLKYSFNHLLILCHRECGFIGYKAVAHSGGFESSLCFIFGSLPRPPEA